MSLNSTFENLQMTRLNQKYPFYVTLKELLPNCSQFPVSAKLFCISDRDEKWNKDVSFEDTRTRSIPTYLCCSLALFIWRTSHIFKRHSLLHYWWCCSDLIERLKWLRMDMDIRVPAKSSSLLEALEKLLISVQVCQPCFLQNICL